MASNNRSKNNYLCRSLKPTATVNNDVTNFCKPVDKDFDFIKSRPPRNPKLPIRIPDPAMSVIQRFSFTYSVISGLREKFRHTDDEFALRFLESAIGLLRTTIFDDDDITMTEMEYIEEFPAVDGWVDNDPGETDHKVAGTAQIVVPFNQADELLENLSPDTDNAAKHEAENPTEKFYDACAVQPPSNETWHLDVNHSLLKHCVGLRQPYGKCVAERYNGGLKAARARIVDPPPFQSAIIRRKQLKKAIFHKAGLMHRIAKRPERTDVDVWISFSRALLLLFCGSMAIGVYLDGRATSNKGSYPDKYSTGVLCNVFPLEKKCIYLHEDGIESGQKSKYATGVLCNVFLLERKCICLQEDQMAIQSEKKRKYTAGVLCNVFFLEWKCVCLQEDGIAIQNGGKEQQTCFFCENLSKGAAPVNKRPSDSDLNATEKHISVTPPADKVYEILIDDGERIQKHSLAGIVKTSAPKGNMQRHKNVQVAFSMES